MREDSKVVKLKAELANKKVPENESEAIFLQPKSRKNGFTS